MSTKKVEHQYGQKITCPYCGKEGKFLRAWGDDSVDVLHLEGEKTLINHATGEPFVIKTFLDGCSKHGKLGSHHMPKSREELEIQEEEL